MKKIIAILLVSIMFFSSTFALNINEAKENYNEIKKDLDEKYVKMGDKFIEKLSKKYNKKEMQYMSKRIDKVLKRFEGKKVSEKTENILFMLKYVKAGLQVKAFEKKDEKVNVVYNGKINRAENHTFKLKLYKKEDGFFKTVKHANAFLIAKNKLVTSSKYFDSNFDNIAICQSSSAFNLVECDFVGSLIKKDGNIALIEISNKSIDGKKVSISPSITDSLEITDDSSLTITHFSDNEIDNMELEDDITNKSNISSSRLGAGVFDVNWINAGVVLEEESKNKIITLKEINEKIKSFINDKPEEIKNINDFKSQLKIENSVYIQDNKDFKGKVIIRDLFKNFSRFDFAVASDAKRDYITYDNSDFETEIKIFNLEKDEIDKKIKEVGKKYLTKEVFESEVCKKDGNKTNCEIEYETGKNITLNFIKSDNKLVYILTHTTSKDNFKKSKEFAEKISKNIVFK